MGRKLMILHEIAHPSSNIQFKNLRVRNKTKSQGSLVTLLS